MATKKSKKAAAKKAPAKKKPAPVSKAKKPEPKPKAAPKPKALTAPAKAPSKAKKPTPQAQAKADTTKAAEAAKPARKGITIVSPKPVKKEKKPVAGLQPPPGLGRLLDPHNPIRRPLIPSGPKAAAQRPLGQHGGVDTDEPLPKAKSPFGKRDLDRFRQILVQKRAELVGDVSMMEKQALRGDAGSLSNMPSHLAEQGSDASDQSLSLDLAAADRKLIREIDDALKRIEAGTYGICERTGKPIKVERLEELPWARFSIEAARELERLAMRP